MSYQKQTTKKGQKYVGTFISSENTTYDLEVNCNGFIEAFILLTADAIRGGKSYQLRKITTGYGSVMYVRDIAKCSDMLY